MAKLEVSIANPDDIQHLAKIAEGSPFQPSPDTAVGICTLTRHIGEKRALLARLDGQVAGSLLFRPHLWDEMEPYIEHVDVLSAFRSRGVGRALMAGAERVAIQNGHGIIYSSTGENNTVSRAFHQALGFAIDCYYPLRTQSYRELMMSKLVLPPITLPPDTEITL